MERERCDLGLIPEAQGRTDAEAQTNGAAILLYDVSGLPPAVQYSESHIKRAWWAAVVAPLKIR
eukprot:53273-Eustigmatos_ZCMA.PRE.1